MTDRDGNYSTKETALAAYLYMEGFQLVDVDIDKFPSTFIFSSSEQLLDCVRLFQVCKAEGNLGQYFEAYRKCLKMTKVGKL